MRFLPLVRSLALVTSAPGSRLDARAPTVGELAGATGGTEEQIL